MRAGKGLWGFPHIIGFEESQETFLFFFYKLFLCHQDKKKLFPHLLLMLFPLFSCSITGGALPPKKSSRWTKSRTSTLSQKLFFHLFDFHCFFSFHCWAHLILQLIWKDTKFGPKRLCSPVLWSWKKCLFCQSELSWLQWRVGRPQIKAFQSNNSWSHMAQLQNSKQQRLLPSSTLFDQLHMTRIIRAAGRLSS